MPVTHTIGSLERDLLKMSRQASRGFDRAAQVAARDGNRVAKASAVKRSGIHGRHHPKAYRTERRGPAHYVFGPISSMKQGGMAFEEGPGPQTSPHHNLKRGAEVVERQLHVDARNVLNSLFWPG